MMPRRYEAQYHINLLFHKACKLSRMVVQDHDAPCPSRMAGNSTGVLHFSLPELPPLWTNALGASMKRVASPACGQLFGRRSWQFEVASGRACHGFEVKSGG